MIRERLLARASRNSQDRSRLAGRRGAVDIQNVDQALYRPDLGFKMTNSGYDEYKRGEGEFGKDYESVIASNKSAIEQNQANLATVNDALSQLGQVSNTPVDALFAQAQASWVPVYVGTINGPSSSNVYRVPRELANAIASGQSGSGLTAFYMSVPPGQVTDRSQWTTNTGKKNEISGVSDPAQQNYLVVSPFTQGGNYPQQVEAAVANMYGQVKNEFYTQATSKLEDLAPKYQEYTDQANALQTAINTSQDNITQAENAKALRDNTKEAYKKQYETSVSERKALFEGF